MPADAPTGLAGSVLNVDLGGDEDYAEPERPVGSPVHPDDRLWRHPSELISSGLPAAWRPADHPTAVATRDRRLPVLLAGAVGSLLTRARGRVACPLLGVEGTDCAMNGGAVVQRVRPASPAAAAGLVEGDVVTGMNGAAVADMGTLLLGLRLHQPGDTIQLVVLRAGHQIELPVTIATGA